VERGKAAELTGYQIRRGREILAQLLKAGLLVSQGPRALDQWQAVLVVVVLESEFGSSVRVVVDWHFVPAGGTIGAGAAVFIGGVKLGANDGSNVAIAAADVPESCPALG
jgi:hypothetical protein